MIGYLMHRLLDRFARRHDYDVSYMRMIVNASPAAFRKFRMVSALSGHREAVPVEASHAARLVGIAVEDCGPCIQLVADMARDAGMSDAHIIAVLTRDDAALPPSTQLACRYARALVERSPALADLREEVHRQWGDKGVVDLCFATQMTRIYPMVKTGLGFANACQQVWLGSKVVPKGASHTHGA